jgi:uncharacterized membrane protein YbhN (UPF0104 family)
MATDLLLALLAMAALFVPLGFAWWALSRTARRHRRPRRKSGPLR